MHSTPEEIEHFRRGRLPPAMVPELTEWVGHLARHGTLGDSLAQMNGTYTGMSSTDRAERLRNDLTTGAVVAVDGQMVLRATGMNRAAWQLDSPHSTIDWVERVYKRPLPGPWRFFVLPTSMLVVGAEAYGGSAHDPGAPTPAHVERYRSLLLEAQGLTAADLEVLRAGGLPPAAQARVVHVTAGGLALALIATLAALATLVVAVVAPLVPLLEVAGRPVGAVALAAPVLLLMGTGLAVRAATSKPLTQQRVTTVTGRGWAERLGSSRSVVEVGEWRFSDNLNPLVRDVRDTVVLGYPLRAYVVGSRPTLVAIEPA